jgi:hypothetical protein
MLAASLPSWPDGKAGRVKLVTPKEFKTESAFCFLNYNEPERIFSIVTENDEVLDQIDLDDMIGAKLEVQLNETEDTKPKEEEEQQSDRDSNEPPTDVLTDRQGKAVLMLYTYPRKDPSSLMTTPTALLNKLGVSSYRPKPTPHYTRPTDVSNYGPRVSYPRRFVVAPAEDLQDVSTLTAVLQQYATGWTSAPPHYLVLVNPCSGPKRNGKEVAEKIIIPMLEESGIDCDLFVTQYAQHATERAAVATYEKDISEYDGLVLVGGDGMIHEVINGIMARDDHESVLSKLKCGIVGCGTANGFATSLCRESNEKYGPINETYMICKGRSVAADLSRYQTSSKQYASFLTFSWAMIADIDIESERIHWLGESRFDVWGVLRVLALRRYRGRLSYWPPSSNNNDSHPIGMPALTEPVPSEWKVIEDDFAVFWASHVSHASVSLSRPPMLCGFLFSCLYRL